MQQAGEHGPSAGLGAQREASRRQRAGGETRCEESDMLGCEDLFSENIKHFQALKMNVCVKDLTTMGSMKFRSARSPTDNIYHDHLF